MLSKKYRLGNSAQIGDVRRGGRSWQNRWLVLVKRANGRQVSRFAFSVSRRLGKAVVRNRLKRVMRECIRRRLPTLQAGWDVLLIARLPAQDASFEQIDGAIADVLSQSRLWASNACACLSQLSQASVDIDQTPGGCGMRM